MPQRPEVIELARVLVRVDDPETDPDEIWNGNPNWHLWLPEARAALAYVIDVVLAEPNGAMLMAAHPMSPVETGRVYRAMLAARRRELLGGGE